MAAQGFKEIAIVVGHFEKHVLPPRLTSVAGKAGEAVSGSCFRPALCRGTGR
jgi:hypothetical protein